MMLVDLKIAILQRGISQAALAQAIGRTPAHVSRLIHGRVRIRAHDRRQIAAFLGVAEAKVFLRHSKQRGGLRLHRTGPVR